MKINPEVFKAYDIRGSYPEEINEKIAYKIGRAFVEFIKEEKGKEKIDILLGRDNRLSSPSLFKSLTEGILDSEANVVSIGLCTTPMSYFASSHLRLGDGGIMITASHLPPERNGFKLMKRAPLIVDQKTGLKEIKRLVLKNNFPKIEERGKIIEKDIFRDYIDFNLKEFDLSKISPLRVVVDTGNGVSGILIPKIFQKTSCKIFHIFSELDGTFPNRSPDFFEKGSLRKLKEKVKQKKADLGVAFDGDGDRIAFLDEKGKFISPDVIFALLISEILKENPSKKILYTVLSSREVPKTIKENGGKGVLFRVGHSLIKRKMKKEKIFFGGEISGHYYYKRNYFCEAPLFVLFEILKIISESQKKISELILPFQKYYCSREINFKLENPRKEIRKVKEIYSGGRLNELDGLRVDFDNWWFSVRPSGTEKDVLRLFVGAEKKELMEEKKKELADLIKSHSISKVEP